MRPGVDRDMRLGAPLFERVDLIFVLHGQRDLVQSVQKRVPTEVVCLAIFVDDELRAYPGVVRNLTGFQIDGESVPGPTLGVLHDGGHHLFGEQYRHEPVLEAILVEDVRKA